MALAILDGTQTATTLSTILSSGQHITAHTVVSLGTQAITDMQSAVSGSVVSISNFPASQSTTFGAVTGSVSILNFPASQAVTFTDASLTNTQLRASAVTVGGTVTVGNSLTVSSLPAISGVVTANIGTFQVKNFNNVITSGYFKQAGDDSLAVSGMGDDGAVLSHLSSVYGVNLSAAVGSLPISGTVTVGNTVTIAGTVTANPTGTQTITGSVTIAAGTAQIGSVTASISNFPVSTVVSAYGLGTDGTWRGLEMMAGSNRLRVDAINSQGGSSFPISGSVTLGAGTAQIGSVTASISGTIPISISSVTVGNSVTIGSLPAISGTVTANTFALQGTAVTTSNFTSTTASTVLASYNATREVLTIFNEGAGNLHISPGATCTTVQYQVRLSSGDYYEVPNHQTTITHSAVFATAGTARVTEVT